MNASLAGLKGTKKDNFFFSRYQRPRLTAIGIQWCSQILQLAQVQCQRASFWHMWLQPLSKPGRLANKYTIQIDSWPRLDGRLLYSQVQNILLQDMNVAVDLGPMSLCHALRNPYNVSRLLFLQFHICIENSEMKLSHECIYHHLHLEITERVWTRGIKRHHYSQQGSPCVKSV